MPANEVLIKVKAQDQASAKIDGIAGKLKTGLPIAAAAGAAAVVGIGVAAIKMAADFDKAFGEVTTLFDAPESQVKALRTGVKDLAREMGVDATKAAEALYSAISAGVDPNNAVAFLRENTKFAVAGVTDLNTAVDLTTTVMNAWKMEASELGRVQDVLFTGVQAGKTTVDELGASIFQVAPIAAATGVSIESVTAGLATLTAQGTPTRVAATQLRAAIVELAKGGTAASTAFEELSGQTFPEFIASGHNVSDAFNLLSDGAAASDKSVVDMFGSIEAGQAVLALTGEGAEGFKQNLEKMAGASGATDAAFDKMNGTFDRQFQILKGQLKGILLDIGESVLPLLIRAMERLNPWLQEHIPRAIEWMRAKWIELQPEIENFQRFMKEDVLPVLEDIVQFIETSWPIISAVVTAVMEEVVHRIQTVVDIIQVVTALLRGDWGEAWEEFKNLIHNQVEAIKVKIENVWGIITAVFDAAGINLGELGQAFVDMKDSAIETMAELLTSVTDAMDDIRGLFEGLASDMFGYGVDIVQGLWDGIASMKGWILDKVKGLGGEILGSLKDGLGKLNPFSPSEFGIEVGEGLIEGIILGIENMLGDLRRIGSSLQSELRRLLSLPTQESAAADAELAKLRLAEFDIEEKAETERIARLEQISNLEEALAEARRDGNEEAVAWLERQIQIAEDYRRPAEAQLESIRAQIAALEEAAERRRLENDLLAAQGLLADQNLASQQEVNAAVATWIEVIRQTSELIGEFTDDLYTSTIPALHSLRQTIFNAVAPMISAGIALGTLPADAMLDFLRRLPQLHEGGIVPGLPGREVLALVEPGERIVSREDVESGGSGGITQNFYIEDRSPTAIAHAVEMASEHFGERLALEGV